MTQAAKVDRSVHGAPGCAALPLAAACRAGPRAAALLNHAQAPLVKGHQAASHAARLSAHVRCICSPAPVSRHPGTMLEDSTGQQAIMHSSYTSFSWHTQDMGADAAQVYLSLAGPVTGPAAAPGPAPRSLRPDEPQSQHLEPRPPPLPPCHSPEHHGCPRGRPAAGGCQAGRLKQHCSRMQLPGQCLLLSPRCMAACWWTLQKPPSYFGCPTGHLQLEAGSQARAAAATPVSCLATPCSCLAPAELPIAAGLAAGGGC